MKRFRVGQRVRIVADEESKEADPMVGKVGTVRRIKRDGDAYVDMDEPLPANIHEFYAKGAATPNSILLEPGWCKEVTNG